MTFINMIEESECSDWLKGIGSLYLHSSKSRRSVCMIGKYEGWVKMTPSQSSRPEFLAGSANPLLWLHTGITQEAAKAPSTQASPGLDPQHRGSCWGYDTEQHGQAPAALSWQCNQGRLKTCKNCKIWQVVSQVMKKQQREVERVDEQSV